MARVQLMFNKRDTQKALDVQMMFNEVGGALRGKAGDKCLEASKVIAESLVLLELIDGPPAFGEQAENGELDHGCDPSGNPSRTF